MTEGMSGGHRQQQWPQTPNLRCAQNQWHYRWGQWGRLHRHDVHTHSIQDKRKTVGYQSARPLSDALAASAWGSQKSMSMAR
jgi:hypothetical protein